MANLPPPGTRIRNAFNGETFIFTHMNDRVDEVQFDVFLERGGMLTGTGRQHFHPGAEEEFIVQTGALKLMVDGKWRMLRTGRGLHSPARQRRICSATAMTGKRCSPPSSAPRRISCAFFSTCR